jgi:methylase of polypeptide subunit release factors
VSFDALKLAKQNLEHNISSGSLSKLAAEQISFEYGNVLQDDSKIVQHTSFDIVVSNPPYISPAGYDKNTSRSVRNWEPKHALVPPSLPNGTSKKDLTTNQEDCFYPHILSIASKANAKVILMETGDIHQAIRVASMARRCGKWNDIEIWRDWPDQPDTGHQRQLETNSDSEGIRIRGQGHGRSVLCWSKELKKKKIQS